jgi:hypothetical protein
LSYRVVCECAARCERQTLYTVIMCIAGTSKLSITADDDIDELFVDGVKTNFLPGGWKTVRLVDIPANTRVIAVKAKDTAKVSTPDVWL